MMAMISRYLHDSGNGTLVLSDGEIREFKKEEWIDTEYEPGIGQKVLYKSDQNGTEIRIITEEEIEALKNNSLKEETAVEKPSEEESSNNQFATVEEAIEHYLNLGFKKTIDKENNGVRSISMRYFDAQGEFGEAIISVNVENIEVKETRNGKPI